jgi:hypothetical protein
VILDISVYIEYNKKLGCSVSGTIKSSPVTALTISAILSKYQGSIKCSSLIFKKLLHVLATISHHGKAKSPEKHKASLIREFIHQQ